MIHSLLLALSVAPCQDVLPDRLREPVALPGARTAEADPADTSGVLNILRDGAVVAGGETLVAAGEDGDAAWRAVGRWIADWAEGAGHERLGGDGPEVVRDWLVLRADVDAPFLRSMRILELAARSLAPKVAFAAHREERSASSSRPRARAATAAPDGLLPVLLPVGPSEAERFSVVIESRSRDGRSSPAYRLESLLLDDVQQLQALLREREEWVRERRAVLDARSGATTGQVLAAIDSLRMVGPVEITFTGPPDMWGTPVPLERLLAWVAEAQGENGSWGQGDVGATALALWALTGDGNTLGGGPYRANVSRAAQWLKRSQDPKSGRFGDADSLAQVQASLVLFDIYHYSGSPLLRGTTEAALRALREAALVDADPALVPWTALALSAANESGLGSSEELLERLLGRLESNDDDVAALAPAAFTRILVSHALPPLGWRRTLATFAPDDDCDELTLFFTAHASFQTGGSVWEHWVDVCGNGVARRALAACELRPTADHVRRAALLALTLESPWMFVRFASKK